MTAVVAALEILGVLLVAAAAGVAAATYIALWAGLLAAGLVVLAAAAWAEQMTGGGDRHVSPSNSATTR